MVGSPGRSSSSPDAPPSHRELLSRREYVKGAAATGLVAGLGGCALGQTGTTGDGTTVQLVADSTAKDGAETINRALHAAGLSGDIDVEVLAVSSDTAQQQYSQWLSAGLEQPSLLRMDNGWTIPFILRDQVVDLSEAIPEVTQRLKEEFFAAGMETATGPDGGVYGVPLFTDFGLMLYRKDLMEEAGVDHGGWATNPPTWERFSKAVKRTLESTETSHGFTFQGTIYEGLPCCTFNEFMTTRGGSYFGARENLIGHVGERPVTVDSQPVIDANRMVRTFILGTDDPHSMDGVAGGISPQAVLSWDEQPSLSDFTGGNAVAHRNWPYSVLSAGAADAFGEGLGVMPIPRGVPPEEAPFDGMGGSRSALGGWHVTLNPNARHEQAALAVLRAVSRDEFYLAMMKEFGYVPPKPALLDTQAARNIEVMGRYVDTLKFAGEHAVPRPVSVVWPRESPRIAQRVSATFAGEQAPQPAMATLKEDLVQIERSVGEARG